MIIGHRFDGLDIMKGCSGTGLPAPFVCRS